MPQPQLASENVDQEKYPASLSPLNDKMTLQFAREQENKVFQSIHPLTENEMLNVDQWLSVLHDAYETLDYPIAHRVLQATTYFNEEQKLWYKDTSTEINNDWSCFCEKLKAHIHNCQHTEGKATSIEHSSSSVNEMPALENIIDMKFIKYSGTGDAKYWLLQTMYQFRQCELCRMEQFQSIPFLLIDEAYLWYVEHLDSITNFESFSKLFLQQYSSTSPIEQKMNLIETVAPLTTNSNASSLSRLQQTIADDIIKKPTFFRGSKDDVHGWIEKLEQRFKMAKWTDEEKLQYISIHLQEDAYRWWTQISATIKTWSSFIEAVAKAFGSTKEQELAFEQLKWYKQTIGQSITQYYDKTIELCKKVDSAMPDSLKLKYLTAGMKESLKLHVALQDPKTTDAFLMVARKVEDTLTLANTIDLIQPNNININATTSQSSLTQPNISLHKMNKNCADMQLPYSQVRHSNYRQHQHNRNQQKQRNYAPTRYPQYTQRSNNCFNCGTPGHYARDCTRPRFEQRNVPVNNKKMKVLIDTGANQSFISITALPSLNGRQFVNDSHKRVTLADGSTSLSILGTWNLVIMMGDVLTSIEALVVNELCADCILGMNFIDKYKLIINMEQRTISICNNYQRTTLNFDVNKNDVHYPARLISSIQIPPKRTVSAPVSVRLSSPNVLFRPSYKFLQRSPVLMLNSSLTIRHHTSSVSLYNPTNDLCSLPKGIILGTTTIPTLSFKRNETIDQQLVNKNIAQLCQHIGDSEQHHQVQLILNQHAKLFDTSKPTIANGVKAHAIKILDHPPPASKPYYTTPHKQEEMYKITQELLYYGLIRPSYSPFAAPALLVPKRDGTWRMVVDYKKLNNITIKDNHPLPNMEQAIQILGGGYKFFSKLDMKSGFWQIPINEEDKYKTAFITTDGLYEWNVLAQGLKNSPPSFQRVMVDVLSPCRQFALVYIDDIVVFSRSFDDHLNHIRQVLSILLKHNFQLNPDKCDIFRPQINYLSHAITEHGVKPNNEKIQAIINLKEPATLAEANKFLGAISWYRKFLPQFATLAAPIHRVTNLTKPNRRQFVWCDVQSQAFKQLQALLIRSPLFLDFPNDKYPLILTTDASKVGIGGTLQQNINGEIKNLYYHSQVTTSSQRRYDPIELEALAIWLCFQRMRSYLLGRPIIIYTDHCPLCRMMNSTVKNRRVDRISILLQEYDIEKIIHIKGQHNCLADYLSRHPIQYQEDIFDEDYGISTLFQREPPSLVPVSDNNPQVLSPIMTRSKTKQLAQQLHSDHIVTPSIPHGESPSSCTKTCTSSNHIKPNVIPSNSFDITQLKNEQANDLVIQNKIKEVKNDLNKHPYVLIDGLLYKLTTIRNNSITKTKVLYLPTSMINSLLHSYHTHPLGGHFGVRRTYLKIKPKYWWPNMKQSIIQYIRSCLSCQQFNINRTKKAGQLHPIPIPEGPFQLIGIDYCGPFKKTPRENQYVLCITDYFTRWVTAVALPDCSAQTTARAIFNEHICRYGVPNSILTDQGTHFKNQLMAAMAKLIGYNHIFSSVYHPQTNGMVERFNGTFVPQIAKLQDRENNNWDEFLLPVVFAYNTGVHATTGYSPFELQFGRSPRLPTDEPLQSFTFNKPQDYYEQLKKNLFTFQQQTRDNVNRQQQLYKSRYDARRADPHYKINDTVLIRSHGIKNKLDPKYSLNPKLIVKQQHPNYWVKDTETQVESKVHVSDIRSLCTS